MENWKRQLHFFGGYCSYQALERALDGRNPLVIDQKHFETITQIKMSMTFCVKLGKFRDEITNHKN